MDTIIDFFNHYNKTLAAEINALPEDNITVILSCDFFVNSLDEKCFNGINIFSHSEYIFNSFDKKCIILPTDFVDEEYIFNRIALYISKKIDVVNLCEMTADHIDKLAVLADKNGVIFENHAEKLNLQSDIIENNKLSSVPMVYINGFDPACEQFTTHLMLSHICEQKGIRTLNITSYAEGKLFDFADLSKILDINKNTKHLSFTTINKRINNLLDDTTDIIIISDSQPLLSIESIVEKELTYGYNHFLLKSSVGCDYYIYNIPANLIRNADVDSLTDNLNRMTDFTPTAFGFSHKVIYKTNSKDNFASVIAQDEEYENLYKSADFKNVKFDTQNRDSILNNLNIW